MGSSEQIFPVGQPIVCRDAHGSLGELSVGSVYVSLEPPTARRSSSLKHYVWVRADNGKVGEYFSSRFETVDDNAVYKPHVIVRTSDPPKHIGPYNSDREAETAAAKAFPDGQWIVFELSPKM